MLFRPGESIGIMNTGTDQEPHFTLDCAYFCEKDQLPKTFCLMGPDLSELLLTASNIKNKDDNKSEKSD